MWQNYKKNQFFNARLFVLNCVDQRKFYIIFNETKGGTGYFGWFCHTHIVPTLEDLLRWLMRIFQGMLNQAAINACNILLQCKHVN